MKKFFTLIAAALLSSGAFAQSEWQNLVVNGDMEGEADPMWSSFWCHDWRQGVEFQFRHHKVGHLSFVIFVKAV